VKFDVVGPFVAEFDRLSDREKVLFSEAIREINRTYRRQHRGGIPHWPGSLRIKRVEGWRGVWEMTWSFAGPAGRATFEYFDAGDGEVGIRWRRIGGHEIFRDP